MSRRFVVAAALAAMDSLPDLPAEDAVELAARVAAMDPRWAGKGRQTPANGVIPASGAEDALGDTPDADSAPETRAGGDDQ